MNTPVRHLVSAIRALVDMEHAQLVTPCVRVRDNGSHRAVREPGLPARACTPRRNRRRWPHAVCAAQRIHQPVVQMGPLSNRAHWKCNLWQTYAAACALDAALPARPSSMPGAHKGTADLAIPKLPIHLLLHAHSTTGTPRRRTPPPAHASLCPWVMSSLSTHPKCSSPWYSADGS
ncbi:hypothetical protein K466DRAFT_227470 [Polyporus arcularius HHB13444]|uniref:Uncharacterized protein n=1 Tax=Polyporus arcularius HHB13444 TaxID=1314778 RepID=A0A5C3PET0_9APHY|nr:hypothetical protein K466DRAFT_227470 [Polyporus arcularius HHB13444]